MARAKLRHPVQDNSFPIFDPFALAFDERPAERIFDEEMERYLWGHTPEPNRSIERMMRDNRAAGL